MCTGSHVDERTTAPWGKLEPIAPKGTKCAYGCKFKGLDTRLCYPSEAEYSHFLCIQLVLTKEIRFLGPQRG